MRPRRTRAKGYIEDLLDCCERIARYTAGVSRQTFLSESMMQDATIRNLEIMGEASRQLRDVLPSAYDRFPSIPFTRMYALRNELAHGYITVDVEIVWNVVEHELPQLQPLLIELLAKWPVDLI
jgi:uncharacterized protein with HEPN domain